MYACGSLRGQVKERCNHISTGEPTYAYMHTGMHTERAACRPLCVVHGHAWAHTHTLYIHDSCAKGVLGCVSACMYVHVAMCPCTYVAHSRINGLIFEVCMCTHVYLHGSCQHVCVNLYMSISADVMCLVLSATSRRLTISHINPETLHILRNRSICRVWKSRGPVSRHPYCKHLSSGPYSVGSAIVSLEAVLMPAWYSQDEVSGELRSLPGACP